MDVLAYVPDLMDRSKVAHAFPNARFVNRAADLAGQAAELVLVDLGRPGALDVLEHLGAGRVVGFASHVDRPTLDAARAVGCDAMPRSAFFASLPDL